MERCLKQTTPDRSAGQSSPQPGEEGQVRKIPPGPDGQALADSVRNVQEDPLRFILSLIRQYGDAVRYETTFGPVYLFNHPDHLKEILQRDSYVRSALVKMVLGEGLLASDGKYWRRQRRLMQPRFTERRIAAFGPLITNATSVMLDRWAGLAERQQPLDVALEMRSLTLDLITRALFSVDVSGKTDTLCDAITTLIQDLGNFSNTMLNAPLNFTPERNRRFQTALQTIDRFVYEIIGTRRKQNEKPDDLLSLLMTASDDTGAGLDDRQVRDEVVTMLVAGHETTALTLGWAWYLLVENPEAERRLHAEVDQVLEGRLPVVADLPDLPYTRMVMQEAMRLYPPVWCMVRKAEADDRIAGYDIPANAFIIVCPYTTHRHADFWENPDRFDPERFVPAIAEGRHRYAFLPFAGGRHICLGNHFAMMEGQLIIAAIAQRYKMHSATGRPVEVEPTLTLRQRHGFLATLNSRTAS